MPHYAVSDLGLHCLPKTVKFEARLIVFWVIFPVFLSSADFFSKLTF